MTEIDDNGNAMVSGQKKEKKENEILVAGGEEDAGNVEVTAGRVEIVKNCNGPNSEYIKLVSSDNREFIVKREHALASKTITSMLNGPYKKKETNIVTLRGISGPVLEVVCRYFELKAEHSNSEKALESFQYDENINLDLLLAAHFLKC